MVKRALHERAAATIVLASAEKLMEASPFQITALNELGLMLVPAHIDDKTLRALRAGGVKVQRVK